MAFFNRERPLQHNESTYEDRQWLTQLQRYIETSINYITKEYLLNFFIKNYSKKNTIQNINTRTLEFTRNDQYNVLAHYIQTHDVPNTVTFYKKTGISGRMIGNIANAVNEAEGTTMTELTNVSLGLQTNVRDPIRVYKIHKPNNIVQYAIISSKNVTQTIYYICLGLIPNWFPTLFEGIDEIRATALKELCKTIGRMDTAQYELKMQACFNLCLVPDEKEIDFTHISSLLNQDLGYKIRELRDSQTHKQNYINNLLSNYEQAKNELQRVTWELSKLTTDAQENNPEDTIEIAKTFKGIVGYTCNGEEHKITIRSKMLLESDAIVKKILSPNNHPAHQHYYIHNEAIRRMYEDLWLNHTLQLEFCTTFVKNQTSAVPSRTLRPSWTRVTSNTIPNPHLIYHNCYGDNRRQLIDANGHNNLEYYLGVLTSSNSNLNTGDATVLNRFCQDMMDKYWNEPILYDVKNKLYVSPRERVESYETV